MGFEKNSISFEFLILNFKKIKARFILILNFSNLK